MEKVITTYMVSHNTLTTFLSHTISKLSWHHMKQVVEDAHECQFFLKLTRTDRREGDGQPRGRAQVSIGMHAHQNF